MNFQQQLQQQLQQNSTEREVVDYPSNHLKHKELYFPKSENGQPSTLTVRILPPAVAGENYNVVAREIFLSARNRNGKDLKSNFVLSPYPNSEDILEQALIRWSAENRVPNAYSRTASPRQRFYVNVVNMITNQQTGQVYPETDQEGNLVVRLLKLPRTACMTISESLSNPMLRPQFSPDVPEEVAQYSFISSAEAYPIMITKPARSNQPTQYGVQVLSNRPLGALPQGWESQLPDLAYQATPSVEYNRKFIEYFISVVDGVEPVAGNQGGQQQATQAPQFTQQPVQPNFTQAPQQPNYSHQATNMGTPPSINGGFNQPPVQPNQGFTQQPAPVQPNQGFAQPAQTAQPNQGFSQPVQQQPVQQPVQQQPVTDPATISDADMPFNMQEMPDVAQPTPAPTQQPASNPTPVQQNVANTPSVDDLLQSMI